MTGTSPAMAQLRGKEKGALYGAPSVFLRF
jgi:hypothetical protein